MTNLSSEQVVQVDLLVYEVQHEEVLSVSSRWMLLQVSISLFVHSLYCFLQKCTGVFQSLVNLSVVMDW